jgi:hypothetical protein
MALSDRVETDETCGDCMRTELAVKLSLCGPAGYLPAQPER